MKRQHFHVLDGLRGVAALAVVAYHFAGRTDLHAMMPRGYLAVDLFFVLSGLVVSHAYLRPLQTTMTIQRFVVLRLIRLWPMLLPGTILGAILELWRPNAGEPVRHMADVAAATVLGCLALPTLFATTMEQTIFPINGPVWSLFFEVVANLAFVAVAVTMWQRRAGWILVLAGAAGLMTCTFTFGTANVGFLLSDWGSGLPRVTFSFFAGMLLNQRLQYFRPVSPTLYPVALLVIFSVPKLPGLLDGALDLVFILAVFPFLVGSAARAGTGLAASRLCDGLGELSYPLYALHYPIIRGICFVVNGHNFAVPLRVAIGVASVLLAAVLSWFVLIWYDRPLRLTLSRRLLPRRMANATSAETVTASPQVGASWLLPTELGPNA